MTARSPRGTSSVSSLLGHAEEAPGSQLMPALVLVLAVILAFHRIIDLDLWLHLAAGRWMMAHHAVPREEIFSFTASGHPWVDLHWGYQFLVTAAHALGRGVGIQILHAVALLASLVLVFAGVRARAAPRLAWLYAALALVTAQERVLTRPEILTGLFLVLTWRVSETIAGGRRPSWLWLLAQIAWANVQGLFILGPILLLLRGAGFAIDGWLRRRVVPFPGAAVRRSALAALCAVAVCAINPFGVQGLVLPFRLSRQIAEASIYSGVLAELLSPFEGHLTGTLFAICLVVALIAWLFDRGRRYADLLPMAFFAALTISARRNLLLFAIVSMGPTVVSLTRITWLARFPRLRASNAGVALGALAMLAAVVWVGGGWHYRAVHSTKETGFGFSRREYPHAAVRYLRALIPGGNVFNAIGDGGFLIWNLGPTWKVAVDGRAEVYGERVGRELFAAYGDTTAFSAFAKRHDVSAILMDTSTSAGCEFLQHVLANGAWSLRYLDGRGAVATRGASDAPPEITPALARTAPLTVPSASPRRRLWNAAALEQMRLARALATLGRSAEATTAYAQLVAMDRSSADAFNDYGAALLATGNLELAGRAFEEAHRLDPGHDLAAAGYGRVLEARQGGAAAEAYLAAWCGAHRHAERAWTTLAAVQARAGHVEQALATLEDAYRRIPAIATPLATLLAQTGQGAKARDLLAAHVRRFPHDAKAVLLMRRLSERRPASAEGGR